MNKLIAITFCFSFLLFTNAQSRFEIPGTRASILIPEGSLTSKHYSAITKLDVFEMTIVEFKGNLETKFREIDSAAYAQRGVKVYDEYDMQVAGYKGKVLNVYSNPEADAVQFLFGDSTFFIMASTLYTRGDKKLLNEIIGYYKSIKFDKSKKIDWDDYLAINYDKKSAFKLDTENIAPLLLMFNKPIETKSFKSYIMISQLPNLGMFQNVEALLATMLSNIIVNNYEVDQFLFEGNNIFKGKEVYEFSAYCKNKKGERHLIYCYARLTDELGTLVSATVTNSEDEKEVKEFFKSMEFKE